MSQASQNLIDNHLERQKFCQYVGMIAERLERLERFQLLVNTPLTTEPDPGLLIYEMTYRQLEPGLPPSGEERTVRQKYLNLEFPSGYHAPTENEEPILLTVAVEGMHMVHQKRFDWQSLLQEGAFKNYGRLSLRGTPITWDELPKGVLTTWIATLQDMLTSLHLELRSKDARRVSTRYQALAEELERLTSQHSDDPRVSLSELTIPILEELVSKPWDAQSRKRVQRGLLRILSDLADIE